MTAADSPSNNPKAKKAYLEAQATIAQAARDCSKSLHLSGLGLTSVPPEIGQLANLTTLYLSKNQLTSVPPEIGQLANLTTLNLHINQLTSVPPDIGQLANLTTLHLHANKLTSVPPDIGQLANLTTLHLHANKLTSVPQEIGQLANLTELALDNNQLTSLPSEIGQLANLTTLYLHRNKLTSVPPDIGQLAKLRELLIDDNQLTSVPPEIGRLANLWKLSLSVNQLTSVPPEICKLANLTELLLYDNQLTSVPPEIGRLANLWKLGLSRNQLTSVTPEIGQLAKLKEIGLSENQLTSVPSEIGQLAKLADLFLYQNQLASLPESLRRCSRLKALFLHDNPKLGLPASVLGISFADWEHEDNTAPKPGPILDYYFRTRDVSERRPLCEGKLILVGRGDVGKTSLVRRLIDNTFSRREDTTQGIRIRKLPVVAGRKKDTIQMHVWDFGGQEIMHATHQLFLTDRSLYLVVLDGRAGQQEAEADYWLRLIASLAPESPVLVVLNKIKKDPFALNRASLQQKYPQVVGFVETDCDNPGRDKKPGKDGQGIDELQKKIAQQVDKLPDIRQPFPNSWFAIKDELCKPRRRNFLTVDQYRALCELHGEASPASQDNLSLFLHRLGIALNFSEDPRLHDKHVLNPHWLTTGIYTLLNSKRLAARKGELAPADLSRELDAKKYPAEMHPFLINLMEKFELCFSFDEPPQRPKKTAKKRSADVAAPVVSLAVSLASRYLIPELLDPEQPEIAARDFNDAKCLNFLYRYPVLPPGLLPRFIVRTHVLSEEHRWKTGVILQFDGNTALVKADPQEKTIRILINGPVAGRRRMLGVIRQDFDVIHRDVPHLKPEELVSFPTASQIHVSYSELEVLYAEDPNTSIKRVVEGKIVTATVRELLEGVEFAPLDEALRPTPGKARRTHRMPEEFEPNYGHGPLRVFYSYSRVDAKRRLRLSKSLSLLERRGLIRTWYDNEILPGAEFDKEIADKLAEADIILLLISDDFMASPYCQNIELPAAMKHRAEAGVDVLPLIIRESHGWKKYEVKWDNQVEGVVLGKLNALPSSGKPVHDWKPADKGWSNIAEGIERVIEARNRGNQPKQ